MTEGTQGSALEVLKGLQKIDREILRYERYRRELPAEVEQKEAELAAIDRQIDSCKSRQKAAQQEQMHQEIELRNVDDRVERIKKMQNEVKTNREFKALQNEIAAVDAEKSDIETKILEAIEKMEAIQGEIEEHETRRTAKERERAASAKMADMERQDLDAKLEQLGGKRTEIATGVPATTLKLYEELLEDKDGLAIAAAEEGVCRGCNFRILPNVLNRLTIMTNESDLVRCDHCGRFLYLEGDA